MASGVHGIIDLTVPAGGSSGSTVEADDADGVGEAKRDLGSMNRILRPRGMRSCIISEGKNGNTCGIDYNET
jgi:hypothetical protein